MLCRVGFVGKRKREVNLLESMTCVFPLSQQPSVYPLLNIYFSQRRARRAGPEWRLFPGKDGRAGGPAAVRGAKANGTRSDRQCQEVENGVNDFTRVERSAGTWDVKIGGKFESVYQEPTWKENGEKTTGHFFKLEGKLRCALT